MHHIFIKALNEPLKEHCELNTGVFWRGGGWSSAPDLPLNKVPSKCIMAREAEGVIEILLYTVQPSVGLCISFCVLHLFFLFVPLNFFLSLPVQRRYWGYSIVFTSSVIWWGLCGRHEIAFKQRGSSSWLASVNLVGCFLFTVYKIKYTSNTQSGVLLFSNLIVAFYIHISFSLRPTK